MNRSVAVATVNLVGFIFSLVVMPPHVAAFHFQFTSVPPVGTA